MNEKPPTKEKHQKLIVEIGSIVLIHLSDEPEEAADVFRVVSPHSLRAPESDTENDTIPKLATDSALGSAILRKSVGDEIEYDTPSGGSLSVKILGIDSP